MYPDLKFTNQGEGDMYFAPFIQDNPINNGLFIPEEFIEEFRTSSLSDNPLSFDLRDILLSADIDYNDEDLKDVRKHYEATENYQNQTLMSYNLNDGDNLDIPLECDALRNLELDIDEDVLVLERDFENTYELDKKYPKGCVPSVIFNKISRFNPRILYVMEQYRIPYPVAKRLTMQIIRLSLDYCARDRED